MEKITILGTEKKVSTGGKPYLRVQTHSGIIACWKPELFDDLVGSVNKEVTVLTETKGDYTNIMLVMAVDIVKEMAKATAVIKKAGITPKASLTSRDEIIVAQVMLKAAVELATNEPGEIRDINEYLTKAVDTLVSTYNYALSSLASL